MRYRLSALSLSVPKARALASISPPDLVRLVNEHLTQPLLWLREQVGNLKRGDTLKINPAPPPGRTDLLGSVFHHAHSMMIEALRVELGLQGIAVESSATRTSITVPALGERDPPANVWAGKTVLVTGASSGLGQATAHELAKRGAIVQGVARRPMKSLSFVNGGRFVPLSADVTKYEELLGALGARRFFSIIHSAGTGSIDLIQHANPDNLHRDIDTNVLGTLNVAKLALARLKRNGHLAIVSSGAARVPWVGGVSYVTAKAAQHAIAVQLAHRLRRRNAAVTAVLAGSFNSGAWVGALKNRLLQAVVGASAHALPRPSRVARQVLADVERGAPVSTAGLGGGTAYTFGELMHLASKSVATTLTTLRLGLPIGRLGSLSAAR